MKMLLGIFLTCATIRKPLFRRAAPMFASGSRSTPIAALYFRTSARLTQGLWVP